MLRRWFAFALVLGSCALAVAGEVKVGDPVFVPFWVEAKVDNKPVEDFRSSGDQFETVQQINGQWLWLGKAWVDRKDVYDRSQLKIERVWSTLIPSGDRDEGFALVGYKVTSALGKFTQSSYTENMVYGCTTKTGSVPADFFQMRERSRTAGIECNLHRSKFADGATGTANYQAHAYEMLSPGSQPLDAWFRNGDGWKIFIVFPVKRDGDTTYVVATPAKVDVDEKTNYATVYAGSLQTALENPEQTRPLKFE